MKKTRTTRTSGNRRAKVATRRAREIQSVFDRLGIGDEASREMFRRWPGVPADAPMEYRIVLAGCTL